MDNKEPTWQPAQNAPKHMDDIDLHTGAKTNSEPGLHRSTSFSVNLARPDAIHFIVENFSNLFIIFLKQLIYLTCWFHLFLLVCFDNWNK